MSINIRTYIHATKNSEMDTKDIKDNFRIQAPIKGKLKIEDNLKGFSFDYLM